MLALMTTRRRDEGFSVAEVVISVAILFFVLTAIVGLLGATSRMTVQAKHKAVLVNAVASEIDRLRALPFDEIVSGYVQREYSGVVIDIAMEVETKQSMGTEYYKLVDITATGVLQGQSLTYDTTVAIRNPSNSMTLATDPDAPQVEFTADAPAADEVVFGAERLSGGSILLKTRAYSPSNGLVQVRYAVGGNTLVQASGAGAVFTPANNPFFASPTWNTEAGGLADGFQTVIVTAEDNQQRTATVKRRFILDNAASQAPGVPAGTAIDSLSVRLTWNAARDGGTGGDPATWYWASRYRYTLYREPATGGGAPTSWPVAAGAEVAAGATPAQAILNKGPIVTDVTVSAGGPALTRAVPPFSRFFARVYSGGPRGIGAAYADSADLVVTRPELICDSSAQSSVQVGAKSGPKYLYTLDLKVTRPNFPFTGTPAYAIYYKTPTGSWFPWTAAKTVTTSSGYDTITSSQPMSLSAYQFKVHVSGITPAGYAGGSPLPTMATNTAKMTGAAKSTTYPLVLDWGIE